ncbi:transcriptional regulator [Marinomonas rhizomae]|uniref:MucB/RseB-like sigma(E) regulatory protein n=1 Tax=Marinomonas rhizomae TaxID=491948 RepID=A0A366J617_9GAMM|nr:MucB/RseB C-terminal domain-containing protein [Marinomonas rhizomae]RBP82473.1 MucB/RseB-like sigma(E) regulatory protein [Marinomonas rhizomae]RNF73735.1 transcriptional regulator [Marinomonas rhizomae]
MRLFSFLHIFFTVLCLTISGVSSASNTTPDALHLLRSMTQSFSTLSYDGVFVHSEAMNINSMRVRHDLMGGVEYESLVDLDGDKIEVLRIDDKIISVYPNALVANMRAPLIPPFRRFKDVESDRLIKGYDMIVGEHTGRIAGRKVVAVKLMPKDQYRYGHQFWLDEENHFLLKHDMLKTNGRLLERIQFTSVNFAPDLKDIDFVPKEGSYAEPEVETQPRRVKNLWQFDWLPKGFSLVWPEARSLNHGTSMLLLSDGMATISIFVEPTMKAKTMSILNMGATIAGERSIKVKDQLYLLTMVGEVPEPTIEKLMTVFMPRQD